MSDTIQNQPVYAAPQQMTEKSRFTFRFLVITLLSLIVMAVTAAAYFQHVGVQYNVDAYCIGLKYDYQYEDGDGDEMIKQSFSDLNAEDRALADRFDCDIDGR